MERGNWNPDLVGSGFGFYCDGQLIIILADCFLLLFGGEKELI